MKRKNPKKPDNRGEIMLEALIVYPITMLLLFFVLAVFSVLYQRWNVQIVANDTVTRVAQTYRFANADEMTGEISKEELTSISPYRYFSNGSKLHMLADANTKAKQYSGWRLANTSYTKNVVEPTCNVAVSQDNLGRRHLTLTIKGSYDVPLGEVLTFFGFESTTEYEVTAYAEGLDIMDYMNAVDFVEAKSSLTDVSNGLFDFADACLNLFQTHILNQE